MDSAGSPAEPDIGSKRSFAYALAAAGVVVAGALPVFLAGALAVQLQDDIGLTAVGIGIAVGAYRGSAALVSVPLGRMADQLGPTPALRLAVLVSAAASAGVALFANGLTSLVVALIIGGVGYALGQTAVNAFIANGVDRRHQGLAFGIKQSAMPAAALGAGLAVPAIALTLGWRWAFGLAAVLGLLAVLAVPRVPRPERRSRAGLGLSMPMSAVLLLGVALALGIGSAATVSAFIVGAAVQAGLSPGPAGVVLSAGSALAILVRVASGSLADRRDGGHMRIVAGMLLVGAVGYLLLIIGSVPGVVVGGLIAIGAGWGFNGLFWFAVVRMNPGSAGAVTGVILPIGLLGGVLGPIAGGWLVDDVSYAALWGAVAAWLVVGAACIGWARRRYRRAVPATRSR